MQLARIYHGHTTGILTVVSKNPLPFFSFRFSSIFFFTAGTAVVFPFYVFVWLLLIVKAKINKQTNKQKKIQKKSGSCQFCKTLFSSATCSTPFVLFHSARQKKKKEKKCVTTLFYIIQIRSHGLSKENDWNRFKFARNPAGDE